jgi:hypothetical protein
MSPQRLFIANFPESMTHVMHKLCSIERKHTFFTPRRLGIISQQWDLNKTFKNVGCQHSWVQDTQKRADSRLGLNRTHKPEPRYLSSYRHYATDWALDESGVRFPARTREVFYNVQTVPEVHRTRDTPLEQSSQCVKLTTILLQVTMLQMRAAIPPLPHTSLRSGVN